jgi:hypothetical protein
MFLAAKFKYLYSVMIDKFPIFFLPENQNHPFSGRPLSFSKLVGKDHCAGNIAESSQSPLDDLSQIKLGH